MTRARRSVSIALTGRPGARARVEVKGRDGSVAQAVVVTLDRDGTSSLAVLMGADDTLFAKQLDGEGTIHFLARDEEPL